MQKQKEYKIADSNMANFGTELEKNVKTAAALSDPAWKKLADGKPKAGLKFWRIEKFTVKAVPFDKEGQFYNGDSYIVLSTYKKEDKFMYDVHFWLGTETTQDEAGTAAIKTVECDDVLGGDPVQHREVEGHESSLFISYFKKQGGIRILQGGIESGFNHVKPEEFTPRLLQVKGKKNVRVTQVPLSADSLNSGDVFILDNGLEIIQFQGIKASGWERQKAAQLCRAIDDERKGKPEVYVVTEGDKGDDHLDDFWKILGGEKPIKAAGEGGKDDDWEKQGTKKLFRISDESGKLTFKLEVEGKIFRSKFDSHDAFLLDVGSELIVWVGKSASDGEKKAGMQMAQDYINANKLPNWLPISRVLEGGENEIFESFLDG